METQTQQKFSVVKKKRLDVSIFASHWWPLHLASKETRHIGLMYLLAPLPLAPTL